MSWISSLKYDLIRHDDLCDSLVERTDAASEDVAGLVEESVRTALDNSFKRLLEKIEDRWDTAREAVDAPSVDALIEKLAGKLEEALEGKVTREAKAEAAAEALDAMTDDLTDLLSSRAGDEELRATWADLLSDSADVEDEAWGEIKAPWEKRQEESAAPVTTQQGLVDLVMTVAKALQKRWLVNTQGDDDLLELENFLRGEL
jgi:hypothetical protein